MSSGIARYKGMIKCKTYIVTSLVAATVLSTILAFFQQHMATGYRSLQSRFVRISDESFSTQTMHTGDTLTVTGTLQSLVNRPLRAWLSLFSESTNAGKRWEFL